MGPRFDELLKARFKAFQYELWMDHERNPPPILYHYTGEETFRKIVTSRELWVCDIDGLNDPSEGKYAMKMLARLAAHKFVPTPVVQIFQKSETLFGVTDHWHQYVACFSEAKNLEHQCNGYADGGKGVALGINSEALFENASGNYAWVRMLYDDAEQQEKLIATIDHVINTSRELGIPDRDLADFWLTGRAAQSLIISALRVKDPGEENSKEREWRIVMLRADREGSESVDGRYHMKLPLATLLDSVVLGPNCSLEPEETQCLLSEHGLPTVSVERATA